MKPRQLLISIFAVVSVLVLSFIVFSGIRQANTKKGTISTNGLDSLVQMELSIPTVKQNAVLLYSVYNDDTYLRAKNNIKMSGELSNKLFATSNFKGVARFTKDPEIEFLEISYAMPSAENPKSKYLLWFTVNGGTTRTEHFVIMEYFNGVLTSVRGY